jgi:hypothetical protein
MSSAGFRLEPVSCRMSARRMRFSPVRVSITTSDTATP